MLARILIAIALLIFTSQVLSGGERIVGSRKSEVVSSK